MAYLLLLGMSTFYFPIKYVDKKISEELNGIFLLTKYNLFRHFIGIITGLVILVALKGRVHFDFYTLLTSFAFSVCAILCVYFGTYAYNIATIATSSLFGCASLIVPVIFGALFLNEKITAGKIVGMAIFLFSVYLITSAKTDKDSKKKFGIKAFSVLMGIMLATGFANVAQQYFANYVENGNTAMFMFLAYVFATIILGVITSVMNCKEGKKAEKLSKPVYIYGIILAVVVFVIQQTTTYFTGVIPSSILFTILNGASVTAGAIIGAIFFKEKLTLKNTSGIILGILSLLMINFL